MVKPRLAHRGQIGSSLLYITLWHSVLHLLYLPGSECRHDVVFSQGSVVAIILLTAKAVAHVDIHVAKAVVYLHALVLVEVVAE